MAQYFSKNMGWLDCVDLVEVEGLEAGGVPAGDVTLWIIH
jgi:hypothetical protein